MTTTLVFIGSQTLTLLMWIAGLGAFFAAFGLCAADRESFDDETKDDENEDDDFDEENPFGFNVSRETIEEYKEYIRDTNTRLMELYEKLKTASEFPGDVLEEIVSLRLGLAARAQEAGDDSEALQNYESAFDAYSRYLDSGGDSQATLKKAAAGRLSYAVALYENGDNDAADKEYVRARQENEELAKLGDREAQVDMLGIDLNRASIISARGDQQGAIELLDETIAELKKLVDDPDYNRYEVPYCLAKAYMSKGWLLRSTFDDDLDCPEAIDSRDAYENAINVFRALVEDGGETQYRRELADALVESMAVTPIRSDEDAKSAIIRLKEAGDAYRKCVILGENDACVDFFETSLERARLLMKIERSAAAFALYDSIIETFDNLAESDELPILEGLATAYQNRAKLRDGDDRDVFKKKLDDLNKAIELQAKIADDLIATLQEENDGCCCGHGHEHDHDGCCCGHGHEHGHDGCCGGHGHEHGHDGCCGGHGHEHGHDGCCGGHGHEHGHDGCCCGGREDGAGDAERQFFVEHWVADNYAALMECLFDRINVRLELNDRKEAREDCVFAETIAKQYRSVLKEKEREALDDEMFEQIRLLRQSL